jgi:RNase P/RNase MRP subunit p30
MELAGIPIPRMDWSAADLPSALRKFKAICDLIFDGPMNEKEEAIKFKYLQIWSGEEGIELISTWRMTESEKKLLNTYWTRFTAYVTPKSNFRISRFKLHRPL